MKQRILKAIDRLLGSSLVRMMPSRVRWRAEVPKRILVIRPGGIGDAVLLLPALKRLRAKFPAAVIDVLAEERNAAVFAMSSAVSSILLYDRIGNLLRAISGKYDTVIDSEQWYRLSACVANMTGAHRVIGFATNERAKFFTAQVAYHEDCHETDNFLRLVEPLGVSVERGEKAVDGPFLDIPVEVTIRIRNEILSHCTGPYIVLFPGASDRRKQWGTNKFMELARLIRSMGIIPVIVGGKKEEKVGEAIAACSQGINTAGERTLVETAAILENASLLVSADSGVLHMASALGVGTVGLFGPSSIVKWGPRGPRDIVITRHFPCSPCSLYGTIPACSSGYRCLEDISLEEVFTSISALLKF